MKFVFNITIIVVCIGLIGLASNSVYSGLQNTIGSHGTEWQKWTEQILNLFEFINNLLLY